MRTSDQAARTPQQPDPQHPDPEHTAALLRRELADAQIRAAIIPTPRRTVMLLTHEEAHRLLRILQAVGQEPW